MEGPVGMYRIKPLFDTSSQINVKTCMYTMKNLHSVDCIQSVQTSGQNEVIKEIEKRQSIILKTLFEIKSQMDALKQKILSETGSPNVVEDSIHTSNKNLNHSRFETLEEVVIKASVHHPPYFLLAINKLWKDAISVNFSCHMHSSVRNFPQNLTVFEKLFENCDHSLAPKLKLRFVWKDVDKNELVISPMKYIPIEGDVNILRFFHRCIFASGDPISETILDSKLDLCLQLGNINNKKVVLGYLHELSRELERNRWMNGDSISVVDIAAWSAIKSMDKIDLPKSLNRWFNECNRLVDLPEPDVIK